MGDEVTTPGRGRGRKRLKDGPPILAHDSGRRVVKTKRGRYVYVESYALVNARTLEEVIGRLTAPELRRCLDLEWANPTKRRKILLRLTTVLYTIQRTEALELIRRTVPAQPPRLGRKFTVAQLERSALATFGPSTRTGKPRRCKGSSYRSTLTKRLHQRKAEIEAAAAAQVAAHGPLSRRERDELRRQAGDHFCGNPCRICGASFQGDKL
jgi:hypothetical protein